MTLPRTFSSPGADACAADWLNPIRELSTPRRPRLLQERPWFGFARTPPRGAVRRMKRWGDLSQDGPTARRRVSARPRRDGRHRDATASAISSTGTRSPRSCSAAGASPSRDASVLSLGIMEKDHPQAIELAKHVLKGGVWEGTFASTARRRHDRLHPGPGRAAAPPVRLGDGHRDHRPRGAAQQRAREGPLRPAGAHRRAARRLPVRRGDAQAGRRDAGAAVRRPLLHRADGGRPAGPPGLPARAAAGSRRPAPGSRWARRSAIPPATTPRRRCAARRPSSSTTSPATTSPPRRGQRAALRRGRHQLRDRRPALRARRDARR